MSGDGPTLSVCNLETHFFTRDGVAKAVDSVSFDVGKGEIMGLVGESGSGKSVTGFSILGLVDPPGEVVGGQVLFNGDDLVGLDDEQMQGLRGNRIAMIFQDPMMTLNPVLRVDTQMIETVLAHDKSISKDEARQRSRDALGQVGIPSPDERLKAYPHQFSGGMRQRLAIAQTLLANPRVLLLDEPFGALDPGIRAEMHELVLSLWKEHQLTVFMVTHDLKEGFYLGTRLWVLDKVRHDPTYHNAYGANITYDLPVGQNDSELYQDIKSDLNKTLAVMP